MREYDFYVRGAPDKIHTVQAEMFGDAWVDAAAWFGVSRELVHWSPRFERLATIPEVREAVFEANRQAALRERGELQS